MDERKYKISVKYPQNNGDLKEVENHSGNADETTRKLYSYGVLEKFSKKQLAEIKQQKTFNLGKGYPDGSKLVVEVVED